MPELPTGLSAFYPKVGSLIQWLRGLKRFWVIERADSLRTIKLRQRLIIPAFVVIFTWYLIDPTPVVMMGTVGLGLLFVAGYWWAYEMAVKVTGKRVLRHTALQVGDELEEEILLENKSFFPVLWAEFLDRSNIPGYNASAVRAANGQTTARWRIRALCSRRGVFTLGKWELTTSDPFDFFSVKHIYHHEMEIVVYPPLAALPARLLAENKSIGDQRSYNQPFFAETMNAVTTRHYVPGDALKHIHWRTSARLGSYYVKVFAPEAFSTVWLIPDLDADAQVGEGNDSTVEKLIMLTATLANQLLDERMSVGLFTYSSCGGVGYGGGVQIVSPQRGQPHFWKILRALAPLQAVPKQTLDQTLDKLMRMSSRRDSLVIMTSSVKPGWVAKLHQLDQRKPFSRIAVILLDSTSLGNLVGMSGVALSVEEQGISAIVLSCRDIKPISAAYGKLRRWEFISTGTGKAVVKERPREGSQNTGSAQNTGLK